MAKAGMKRPGSKELRKSQGNHNTHIQKNDVPPVPEIQGKAKHGKKTAGDI